ncbi:MAG: TlyA family RNA methyltransferase [Desulfobacteraceae bacterium]|jgi:23S rRNA (cytidine1920-2'-O)/16S rRNA (cytidine1409-2'-O)-methyltransferase
MSTKKRLDHLILEKGLAPSRQRGQALIMAGKVLVDGAIVDKPGTSVSIDADIKVKGEDPAYVSRGGLKLAGALEALKISVQDLVCLDIGASTGGFTDCLLQHGAAKVYAVDVGYGQLAWRLRQDDRVVVIERTNIRHMPADCIAEAADLATIDVSFISLRLVVPAVLKFLKPGGQILALIKPQFEVGKGKVGKGGVVRDAALRESVINGLIEFFHQLGLACGPVVPSSILGPKGNQEYILPLTMQNQRPPV